MEKKISIIILHHNRLKIVSKVLDALQDQTVPVNEMEIILVDNSFVNKAAETFSDLVDRIDLQVIPVEMCCPAAARNIGISHAHAPVIMLLDDDVIPEKDCVEKHIELHDRFTEKDIILGKVILHPDIFESDLMRWLYNDGAQFDYTHLDHGHNTKGILYASNVSFRRDIADEFVFNEQFPSSAWEDIELGYRLISKGYNIIYNEHVLGYHYKPETVSSAISRMKKMGKYYPLFVDIAKKQSDIDNLERIVNPDPLRKFINNMKGLLFWNGFIVKKLLEQEVIHCEKFMGSYYYYFFERACRWAHENPDLI